MLKQRIVTAVVLLAGLLPALFSPSAVPLSALTLPLMAAAGWEWARLNGCSPRVSVGAGVGLGAVLLAVWAGVGLGHTSSTLWWWSGLLWLCMTPWLLRRGVTGWSAVPRAVRLAIGWVLLGVAWWALAEARELGVGMIMSVLLLVWVADVAAYFGGKAFGRRKLAPSISPGKSWEGVVSGAVGVFVLAGLWQALWPVDAGPTLLTHVFSYGAGWALLALSLLTAMSVAGDLVESLVKRSAGMKDSSQLLPGHGGVLDRVDALLPVLPLAMMLMHW